MAVIEERGTSWRVAWRFGGTRTGRRESATFTGGDGAEKLALAAKQLVESRSHAMTRAEVYTSVLGPQVGEAGPTLAEFGRKWLAEKEATGEVQPDTAVRYRQLFERRIVPHLGSLPVASITRDTVRGWVIWAGSVHRRRDGSPLSAQTVRRSHAVLHQLLGAAALAGLLPANPAARPAGARKHATGLPRTSVFEGLFLEPWEVEAISAVADEHIRDLMFVLTRTGLRLGEILVLRVQDVLLTGKRPRIMVRRALKSDGTIGPPKTAKSVRDVTTGRDVLAVLTRRASGKSRSALLFPAPRGAVWNENNLRQRHWLPAVAQAQRCIAHPPPEPPKPSRGPRRKLRHDEVSTCDCPGRLLRAPRLHDLRHTHVSLLVEAGWTPKRVQARVGHANYQITMDIYGHLWEGEDGDRLDAMERLLVISDDEAA